MNVRYIPQFSLWVPRDERNREPNHPATLEQLRETDSITNMQLLKALKISLKEKKN